MMPGDGAVRNRSTNLPFGVLLEARDLLLDRGEIEIFQLGLRFRRVLALAAIGKAPALHFDQLGEFAQVAAHRALGFAAEARHALRHIGLEADALLLAVIADIDAGILLPGGDVGHRLVHLGRHQFRIDRLAGLAPDQQVGQHLVARQRADMGDQNAVAADQHGNLPGRSFCLSDCCRLAVP